MPLKQILVVLWRRGWIALLTFVSAIVAVQGLISYFPGRYDATATATVEPGLADRSAGLGWDDEDAVVELLQGDLASLVVSHRVADDVVSRLRLASNPAIQDQFRDSGLSDRTDIVSWMAENLVKNVQVGFGQRSNVLSITYRSGNPLEGALAANTFMAATVDAVVAMRAAEGERTAKWFEPRIDDMRAELAAALAAVEAYQRQSNLLIASPMLEKDNNQLDHLTQQLSAAKIGLAAMQTRAATGATEPTDDPSDPDMEVVSRLRRQLEMSLAASEWLRTTLSANNPRVLAESASEKSLRQQITEATKKANENLKLRIAATQALIASLETARAAASRSVVGVQTQLDQMGELLQNVEFSRARLEAEEKAEAAARLQSRLTFSDISVLDKATPPVTPSFPRPLFSTITAAGAGLTLGIVLALLAEATDRRFRSAGDLRFATSAPLLGVIGSSRPSPRGRLEIARRRVNFG